MTVPKDYRKQYDALPYKRRQLVLADLNRWAGWSNTTTYRKMAGESVTPIERVLLEGVFSHACQPAEKQLEIQFVWDNDTGSPKTNMQKLGSKKKK